MFKSSIKYLLLVLVLIFILEIGLQFLSKKVSPFRSYAEFYDQALLIAEKTDPSKTVYFVGDSTVYGGGSTNPKSFSMPAQFENLLNKSNPKVEILNLGYPGTTAKHHLEVLRRLPERSLVVVRTGINDSWNRFDYYKFYIFGKYYEIRTLKLLVILMHGWRKTEESTSLSKSYYDALDKVATEKKLKLYYVDYFLGMVTFMNKTFMGQSNFINLPKILKNAGYFSKKGFIQRKYLSFDLFHANDLGYRLQAIAIYNFFCREKSLGLSKQQLLPLELNESDHRRAVKRVEKLRNKLLTQGAESFEIFPDLLNATWQLYLLTGNQDIKKDYNALQSIYLYAYHGSYAAINLLNSHQTGSTSTHVFHSVLNDGEINFYYQMVQLFSLKNDAESWKTIYSEWFPTIIDTSKSYSDYTNLPKPFPIEYCPKLLQETSWKPSDVSLKKAWYRIYQEDLSNSKRIIKDSELCSL